MEKMKSKDKYPQDNNKSIGGGRHNFYNHLYLCASTRGLSVPDIMGEFFKDGEFTKREIGNYALYATYLGEIPSACVLLVKALKITEAQALEQNILVDYFDVSKRDPVMWGLSREIDSMLGWKPGTLFPESRPSLQNWLDDIAKR